MSGDVVRLNRGRISPVMVARLWDWMAVRGLREVSLRQVEEATEQHAVEDCWGALKELQRLNLLYHRAADVDLPRHGIWRVNKTARDATVSIKASLYLKALSKAANDYHATRDNAETPMDD